jgi:pyruvate dehydrogenase E1 component
MVEKQDNVFYYLTLLNENYPMPGLKPGIEAQIIKGMYLLEEGEGAKGAPRVNLLGSGTILRESMEARKLLAVDWGVAAHVFSCPSFNELARDGQDCERWNLLHPTEAARVPFVTQQLAAHAGPVIASTDYMKNYAEQIRAFVPAGRAYKVLGTDGFGRSDFRSRAEGTGRRGCAAGAEGRRGDREVRHRRRQDQPPVRLSGVGPARRRSHGSG